ncbi:subtilisin-like protein, partial [Anaeromyces robustus]
MAGYRTAIIVGATDNNIENNEYKKASYSNYGDCVDIYAPGEVTYPNIFNGSTKDYTSIHGTSCATPIVAGVAASIMSEHPEIKFNNELMKKKLIEMSIKDVIVDLKKRGSKDTPNRFINNGKRSIYSPDDGNIYCGILSDNKTLSCFDGCCNKEGKCVNFQNDPWNQCLIENGCQSEFGYCTSKDKSVNECEKELKEYEECLIDISSDMNKEDLMNKCLIIKSDRCDTFYKHQFTNQSVCSIAKYNYDNNNNNNNNNNSYNTSFDFIKNYNQEKYKKYINLCDENLDNYKEECLNNISHIEQYRK